MHGREPAGSSEGLGKRAWRLGSQSSALDPTAGPGWARKSGPYPGTSDRQWSPKAPATTWAISGTGTCSPSHPRMLSARPDIFALLVSGAESRVGGLIHKAQPMCQSLNLRGHKDLECLSFHLLSWLWALAGVEMLGGHEK